MSHIANHDVVWHWVEAPREFALTVVLATAETCTFVMHSQHDPTAR